MSQRKSGNKNREVEIIWKLCNRDLKEALKIYEQQLNVLQSLAGVVLTITGFSGQRIAGTSRFAQVCVIAGLGLVLLNVIWVWKKELNFRWMTSDLVGEPEEIFLRIIKRRDAKTKAYATGGFILCIGFMIYSIAFAKMLIFTTN